MLVGGEFWWEVNSWDRDEIFSLMHLLLLCAGTGSYGRGGWDVVTSMG